MKKRWQNKWPGKTCVDIDWCDARWCRFIQLREWQGRRDTNRHQCYWCVLIKKLFQFKLNCYFQSNPLSYWRRNWTTLKKANPMPSSPHVRRQAPNHSQIWCGRMIRVWIIRPRARFSTIDLRLLKKQTLNLWHFRPSDDDRLTTVTSELKIPKVDRSHHLRKFTCTVKQDGEVVGTKTTDTVNVQWKPTGVTITNEDTYTENSAATIVCSGSFTPAVIWSKLTLIYSWRQSRAKLSLASSKKQRNWAERCERQHLEWLVQSMSSNERYCCSFTSRLIFKCINNDSILASMSQPTR